MLLYPSIRAIAYLEVILKSNIKLNEIIILKSDYNIDKKLLDESKKYKYDNFFKLKEIGLILENFNGKISFANNSDINNSEIIDFVKNSSSDYLLFSGGGILKDKILSVGKKIIHIHPGILPVYRGSTCFYYSILNDFSIGATAFIMDKQLDTGDIIISNRFKINYYINNDQPLFIDDVLDNYLRSKTLESLLNLFSKNKYFKTSKNNNESLSYYVAHPMIRHLAIKKINSNFKKEKELGIFKI